MQLLDEGGVLRQFEDAPAMWTEPVRGPDALHRRDTEPHSLRHRPCCPVGRLVRRRRLRQPDHLGGLAGGDRRLARRPGLVAQQARDTRLGKPFLPAPNGCLRLACGGHDGLRTEVIRSQQDDPRPPDMLLGGVPIGDDCFKPPAVRSRNSDGYSRAHDADSQRGKQTGIPNRTLPFGLVH